MEDCVPDLESERKTNYTSFLQHAAVIYFLLQDNCGIHKQPCGRPGAFLYLSQTTPIIRITVRCNLKLAHLAQSGYLTAWIACTGLAAQQDCLSPILSLQQSPQSKILTSNLTVKIPAVKSLNDHMRKQ